MTDLTHLLSPFTLGDVPLKNRAVMAPMTRSRAIGNVPNDLMADYYSQRAGAGLLITEGVAPSPNGLGYARIPGIFNDEQIAGWQKVTDAAHAKGARLFIQIMHTGRISHPLNMPEGAEVLAPSAIKAAGEMYTDQEGLKPHPAPKEMSEAEIEVTLEEFVTASRNATKAGFDGVELHAANGYLINQFLHPRSNQREDAWGGSPENRNRFAIELARRVSAAIGKGRVGMRLSPNGQFNDLSGYEEEDEQLTSLAKTLGEIGIAYIHLVDHSAMGAPNVPESVKQSIRDAFGGAIILSGGYDGARAEKDLAAGKGELVAFGRPFIANPDLLERYGADADLITPRSELFYTPGPDGYTDYPTMG